MDEIQRRHWDLDHDLILRVEAYVLDVIRQVSENQKSTRSLSLMRRLRVAAVVHALLLRGRTICLRDVYYIDPECYRGSQFFANRALEALTSDLDVPRSRMPIVAAHSGLVAGSLTIDWGDRVVDVRSFGSAGMFVPSRIDRAVALDSDARFILVVEKEAIFSQLANLGFLEELGPCLLVTGKGYPDFATRSLLNVLQASFRSVGRAVPILILTDADPHGMDIAALYQYGRSSRWSSGCRVDEIEDCEWRLSGVGRFWIGLEVGIVDELAIDPRARISLTPSDTKVLESLRQNCRLMSNPVYSYQIHEIRRRGYKLELEALATRREKSLMEDLLIPVIRSFLDHELEAKATS